MTPLTIYKNLEMPLPILVNGFKHLKFTYTAREWKNFFKKNRFTSIISNMKWSTDLERCQLKAQHKKERNTRMRDHINAVLLYDKVWTPSAIAKALLLSDDAIRHHLDEYKELNLPMPKARGFQTGLKHTSLESRKARAKMRKI